MQLYAHPFSSYCQKVLIALYENATLFEYRNLEEPAAKTELEALWPLKRFPVLVDRGRTILETTTIIEYLQIHHGGLARLVPQGDAGIEVRMLDRIFDNYVMTPVQRVVANQLRPEVQRDPYAVKEALGTLDSIYAWLDAHLGQTWGASEDFSLADCSAAPSLFYADWVHEIPATCPRLRAYRARLLAHPSVARTVNEARPFRNYFPLGAPERD